MTAIMIKLKKSRSCRVLSETGGGHLRLSHLRPKPLFQPPSACHVSKQRIE